MMTLVSAQRTKNRLVSHEKATVTKPLQSRPKCELEGIFSDYTMLKVVCLSESTCILAWMCNVDALWCPMRVETYWIYAFKICKEILFEIMTWQDFSVMLDVSSDSLAVRATDFHVLRKQVFRDLEINHVWVNIPFCEISRRFSQTSFAKSLLIEQSDQSDQSEYQTKEQNTKYRADFHPRIYLFWTFWWWQVNSCAFPWTFEKKRRQWASLTYGIPSPSELRISL